jgi:predicted phage terminase large subunit-like protein
MPTDEELQQIWEADARENLAWFLEYESDGAWQPAPHAELVCSALERVERGECKRLILCMPPRHSKSETVSKKFPAWYLGKRPDREVILACHTDTLACDFSRIARGTFREWGKRLWDLELNPESQAVDRWGIAGHRGSMVAVGIGGPITGRGAHLAIVDDPFKNWQEAMSPTIRANILQWYKSTLRTRLAPGGAIIIVMTRWHEEDLVGTLLKEMQKGDPEADQWEIINLPAEAEENDPLGRKPGEWLWSGRFSDSDYRSTKATLGPYLWGGMYQQHPSPLEGNIFKREWWQYFNQWPNLEEFDEIIQSWDMAFKDQKENDFVVGQVWGRKAADKYLLDTTVGHLSFVETLQAVKNMSAKWPTSYAKYVEDKANGPAVINTLHSQVSGLIAVEPMGSKEARAVAASPQVQSGNVYLPSPMLALWVEDFVNELAAFPTGSHDDQVDACTQALLQLEQGVFGIDSLD